MRYFKASLVIGTISLLAMLVIDLTGWLHTADTATGHLLAKIAPDGSLKDAPHTAVLIVAGLLAYIFAWFTADISRPATKTVVALCGLALVLTASATLALYGIFHSPCQAFLTGLLSWLIALCYGGSESGARKRVLGRLFGQRLSRTQFAKLVDSTQPLNFPGTELNATVIVCEIHNHAELLDTLGATDYVAMTNLYLKTVSDYLVEAGGYLDECGGESLRVVFGAPIEREDHAIAGCKAALDAAARIDALNKECDERWRQRLDFRVGISSGPVVGAAYGGARLGAFSVAGTTVEFARRLCAACANYGCRILVGPETYLDASEFVEARPIEMLRRADGRRIEIYEVLAPVNSLSPERAKSRDHFWKGVIYYRERKWDAAMEEFTKARVPGIPDPGLDAYVLRIERARRGETAVQPAATSLAEIS
ncbi:MAG: adenylate/guanylate cyclase domain-containing protein [Chthoniobacterales bacterium]